MQLVDKRCQQLVTKGDSFEGFPSDLKLLGKTHKLKAVHFLKISRGPAFFLTLGLFDGEAQKDMKEGWTKLLKVFHSLLTVHVNTDGGRIGRSSKDAVARLEMNVAEALSTLELTMPAIFFHTMAHILLHVPQAVQKWGSVRNFWAFSMERLTRSYCAAFYLFVRAIIRAIPVLIILLHEFLQYLFFVFYICNN